MSRKKKITLLIIGIICIISLIAGLSYSYFIVRETQDGENAMTSACFKFEFTDENDINLTNSKPMHEKIAEGLTPYTFTIKNLCNYKMEYSINIETLNNTTMDLNAVRYKLNDEDSIILGSITGFILTKLEALFFSNSNRLTMSLAFVFITIALSQLTFDIGPVTVSFSSLLVCMMMGTVFCNLCPRSGDIMNSADKWTGPLFCLFFVLSGADLDLSVFNEGIVILIGLLYILARSTGKYFGAKKSCQLVHTDSNVSKYLGYALLPQAGVALGMSAQAQSLGTYEGRLIRNIVLFSVLIYEIFGPMITKWALTKSGDIVSKPKSKETHERFNTPKDHRH